MADRVWKATRVRLEGPHAWGWQAKIYERRPRKKDGQRIWIKAADGGQIHLDGYGPSVRRGARMVTAAEAAAERDGMGLGLPHMPTVRHNTCAVQLEDVLPVEVCAEWRLDVGLQLAVFYRVPFATRRLILGRRYKGERPAERWTHAAELGSWKYPHHVCQALGVGSRITASLPRTVGAAVFASR